MLQRHCAKHIYIVPDGLKELMSDISREVLRSQPTNMDTFIADYLDALIITRENARVAARLVQSITEISTTTYDILKTTGLSRHEADRIARIIQGAFRKHLREQPVAYRSSDEQIEEVQEINLVSDILDEAKFPPGIAEQAAVIIQNAYRNYKQRREKEKELLHGIIDWRVAARSAIRLYRQTGVTHGEANRAATLIKAAYKGYYNRKMMKTLAKKQKDEEEKEEEEEVEVENVIDDDMLYCDSAAKSEKSVKLNYDSIIPHVDFDEIGFSELSEDNIEEPKDSTASVVVANALQSILRQVVDQTEKNVKPKFVGASLIPLDEEESEKVIDSFSVQDVGHHHDYVNASAYDVNDEINN